MSDSWRYDTSIPMEQKSSASRSVIAEPNANDVLFGRGASRFRWPGNVRFRQLVNEKKEEYLSTTCRARKDSIAREIIEKVRTEQNGRFLIKASATGDESILADGSPGPWVLANGSLVVDKVKQAIREKHYQDSKSAESKRKKTESSRNSDAVVKKENTECAGEDSDAMEKKCSEDPSAKADTEAASSSPSTKRHEVPKRTKESSRQGIQAGASAASAEALDPAHKPGKGSPDRKRQRLEPSSSREPPWKSQLQSRNEETNGKPSAFLAPPSAVGKSRTIQDNAVTELLRRHQQSQMNRSIDRNLGMPQGLPSGPSLYDAGRLDSLIPSSLSWGEMDRRVRSLLDRPSFDQDVAYGRSAAGRSWPLAGDALSRERNLLPPERQLGDLRPGQGGLSQYASLLNSMSNYRSLDNARSPYLPSRIGSLLPGREEPVEDVNLAGHQQQLLRQTAGSSLPPRAPTSIHSDGPTSQQRESLLDSLLHQRRLTDELISLRRRQDELSRNGQ